VRDDSTIVGSQEPPLSAEEVVTVVGQIRVETLGNTPRTAGQFMVGKTYPPRSLFSTRSHHIGADHDVSGSNQAPVWLSLRPNNEVDGMMQSVDEIAVNVTGWTKQGLVPIGHATI
jgi:hypothetical protein